MTTLQLEDELSLSAALRQQTQAVHDQAETAPYVQQLLGGALPLAAYTALVAQNYAIYQALELAADGWRDDPIAGRFVFDELTRVPNLEADLAQLLGPGWADEVQRLLVPATSEYVARLRAAATDSPGAFIAHHYVRYLGDLSGGQVIKASISRIYGEDGHRSTGFYTFPAIEKIKPFRDRYRELLDHAPLTREQQRAVVAEAIVAFELNRSVFADLAERHLPVGGALPADTGAGDGGDHAA